MLKKLIKKAITLLEILVVVVIIGILATLAVPNFNRMRERALDREAEANLRLIEAAEKIYLMEYIQYWACNDTTEVNNNLRLNIPIGRNWNYSTDDSGTGTAARNITGGRTWTLAIDGDPVCTKTDGDPCP